MSPIFLNFGHMLQEWGLKVGIMDYKSIEKTIVLNCMNINWLGKSVLINMMRYMVMTYLILIHLKRYYSNSNQYLIKLAHISVFQIIVNILHLEFVKCSIYRIKYILLNVQVHLINMDFIRRNQLSYHS